MNQEVVTEPRVVGDWREEVATDKVGATGARRAGTTIAAAASPTHTHLKLYRKILSERDCAPW